MTQEILGFEVWGGARAMAKERKYYLSKTLRGNGMKGFFYFHIFQSFQYMKTLFYQRNSSRSRKQMQRSQTYCCHGIIHSALHLCSLWVSGGKESMHIIHALLRKSFPNVCFTNGVSGTSLLSVKYGMKMIIVVTKNAPLQS